MALHNPNNDADPQSHDSPAEPLNGDGHNGAVDDVEAYTASDADVAEELVRGVMPHNVEAEQALLGAILIESDLLADFAVKLKPRDFYKASHRTIYAAMLRLFDSRQPIDYITVSEAIQNLKTDMLEGKASELIDVVDVPIDYLLELAERVPITTNAVHYAQQIRHRAILRDLIEVSREVNRECFEFNGNLAEFLDGVEQRIFDITQRDISNEMVTIRGVLKEIFHKLDEFQDRAGKLTGIPSGFFDLDELTGGFQDGEMIVLAARPSMGKTSIALSILRYIGLTEKMSCAFFSCEMGRSQLVQNMLCGEARLNSMRLRSGHLDEFEYDKLVQAAGKLAEAPVYLDDTPSIGLRELRAKARRLKEKADIHIIFVDYLQLMGRPPGLGRNSSREQEIAIMSRGLKALARELKIPVVVLAQLNRDVEKRTGSHKPRMSDLRESGSIEQDADVIALLHREFYYTRNDEDKDKAQLILAKQRNGPTGEVALAFHSDFMRFDNPEPEFDAPPGGGGGDGFGGPRPLPGPAAGGADPHVYGGGDEFAAAPTNPATPSNEFDHEDGAFDYDGDAPPPFF